MIKRTGQFLMVTMLLLVLMQPAFAAETLASVEKKIDERWQKVSSISANMYMHANVSHSVLGVGLKVNGPLHMQKKGKDKVLYRSEMDGRAVIKPLYVLRIQTNVLSVSDGDIVYSERTSSGNTTVTRAKAGKNAETAPGGGAGKFTEMKKRYDLKLLKDKRFDGRSVYVIAGTPKAGVEKAYSKMQRIEMYFDQETGMQVRSAMYSKRKEVTDKTKEQ
jgi:outer membrane lipoprotein-sorting protein